MEVGFDEMSAPHYAYQVAAAELIGVSAAVDWRSRKTGIEGGDYMYNVYTSLYTSFSF